jgi:CubicO group peptidase (beta-lactamase class C family)
MRLLLAATVLSAATVGAQSSIPDSTARKIDAVFSRYGSFDAPGCALGVYQNGRILYAKGYGSSNIEYGVPLTPSTPMIMGSVSKQFTAAAIALLVEDGRISLSDDVRKYIPELPDYGKTITINHLVHHTSGVRDFWALAEAGGWRLDDGYTVGDMITLATRQKHLNFDPGDEYNYSNTGYVLLGEVVHRVTGKTLRQFAAERIFAPLGMTVSHFHDDHNEPVKGRAIAYSPVRGGGWKIDVWNNDIVGQGGLMTTVEELQKWDENFYIGTVGGPKFLSQQLERGKLNNGTLLTYAFGLEVSEYRGLPIVEHSGSTGGYRTDITRFPVEHTTTVTMCNVSSANSVALAHAVADIVLAAKFTKPVAAAAPRAAGQQGAATPVTVDAAALAPLTGRFYSEELSAFYELSPAPNVLVLRRAHAGPDTLRAVDARTFRGAGLVLRFDAASPAKRFTVENGRARGLEFVRTTER